jgi:putative FmdB family regulatory protein
MRGIRLLRPQQAPEQAADFRHGIGQKRGGEVAVVLSPLAVRRRTARSAWASRTKVIWRYQPVQLLSHLCRNDVESDQCLDCERASLPLPPLQGRTATASHRSTISTPAAENLPMSFFIPRQRRRCSNGRDALLIFLRGARPFLSYRCKGCDALFETLVLSSEAPACPSCGGSDLDQQISAIAPSGKSREILGALRRQAAREGHFSNYKPPEIKRR